MRAVRNCLALFLLLSSCLLGTPATAGRVDTIHLLFSAGPRGGTFDEIAEVIVSRLTRQLPGTEVAKSHSAGSLENLRRVQAGQADLGLVYAGDLHQGLRGEVPGDARRYDQVLVLASLYRAPAHLAVLAGSSVAGVADLAGKRVAVGGPGSGAAATAERYFRALGLWGKIKPQYIGYQEAQSALGHRYIDAIWIFSGLPNTAASHIAAAFPVRFLNLHEAGEKSGFYRQYPFHTPAVIPARTYKGQEEAVMTFQDQALWVAGRQVNADIVYRALQEVFSPAGIQALKKGRPPAPEPSPGEELKNLHPGAARFWEERGAKLR